MAQFFQGGDVQYGQSTNPLQLATMQNKVGSGKGQMNIPQMDMPDWLTTEPDDLLGELMNEYKSTSKYFNPAGINKAYNTSINTTMGMGGQIADNAMRESMARAGQEGGSVNSAMAKAQAMLPVYDTTSKLRTEKATAVADMRTREASMRAGLAQSMGQMRSQYLAMLGDVYMKGKGMNMAWQNQLFNQDMTARQQALQEDQIAYSRRNTSGGGGGAGGNSAPFQGQITRAPNNAGGGPGVEYTPQYKEYLQAQGQSGKEAILEGAPQYPGGGGSGFGNSLDQYNRQFREMLSMANPSVPVYNQSTSDSAGGQMAANMFSATGGRSGFGQPAGYDPAARVGVNSVKMVAGPNGMMVPIPVSTQMPSYNGKPIVRYA